MFDKGTFSTMWKYDGILDKNYLSLAYQIFIPMEVDPEGKLPTKEELVEKIRDAIMDDIEVEDSKDAIDICDDESKVCPDCDEKLLDVIPSYDGGKEIDMHVAYEPSPSNRFLYFCPKCHKAYIY